MCVYAYICMSYVYDIHIHTQMYIMYINYTYIHRSIYFMYMYNIWTHTKYKGYESVSSSSMF